MATQRIGNIGMEPKLNALITFSPENMVSEPVAGNNGVYVFKVLNRTNNQQSYVEEDQIRNLEAANSYRLGGMVYRHLQQNAKIEDNRIRFF